MRKCSRLTPYVRLANGREKAERFREAMRLAIFKKSGKPYYVLVQRGYPNTAIAVGLSKRDVKQSIFSVAVGRMTFREWCHLTMFKLGKAKARGERKKRS